MVWSVGIFIFIIICLLFGDMVYKIVVGCYGDDVVSISVVNVVVEEFGLYRSVFE